MVKKIFFIFFFFFFFIFFYFFFNFFIKIFFIFKGNSFGDKGAKDLSLIILNLNFIEELNLGSKIKKKNNSFIKII
jgi:hypothetical protein